MLDSSGRMKAKGITHSALQCLTGLRKAVSLVMRGFFATVWCMAEKGHEFPV